VRESEPRERHRLTFELRNVGAGSDTVAAGDVAEHSERAIAVFLGSHYCPRSRELVRTLIDHHEAFRSRDTAVLPVLPAIYERARLWDRQYDLPFALLVDPGEGSQETSTAFGTLAPLAETFETLPSVAVCACRPDELRVTSIVTDTNETVPTVGSLLDRIDEYREDGATEDG